MFTNINVGDDDDEVFILRESFSTTLTDVFLVNWHIPINRYLFVLCDSFWFVVVPFVNCLGVIALAHAQFDV